MATVNSKARATRWKIGAVLMVLLAATLLAGETQRRIYAARADTEFQRAQARFRAEPDNPTNAWQFARAAFECAEFADSDTRRAGLAAQGMAACRQSLAREPHSAAAHYYLAMNLGQQARTEFLGALKLVREMEREFKAAGELDPHFDQAGPERNLSLIYRDAPGWPASIGSRPKARASSEQAVSLAPDYPGNSLNLIECYLIWDEGAAAQRELQRLDALWPAAQTTLAGARWESFWDDWSTRRQTVRRKISLLFPPQPP